MEYPCYRSAFRDHSLIIQTIPGDANCILGAVVHQLGTRRLGFGTRRDDRRLPGVPANGGRVGGEEVIAVTSRLCHCDTQQFESIHGSTGTLRVLLAGVANSEPQPCASPQRENDAKDVRTTDHTLSSQSKSILKLFMDDNMRKRLRLRELFDILGTQCSRRCLGSAHFD